VSWIFLIILMALAMTLVSRFKRRELADKVRADRVR
jgi:Na+-transporting methylmalonyl-CoA/oxaloacetate decarboxylase gamma subunit